MSQPSRIKRMKAVLSDTKNEIAEYINNTNKRSGTDKRAVFEKGNLNRRNGINSNNNHVEIAGTNTCRLYINCSTATIIHGEYNRLTNVPTLYNFPEDKTCIYQPHKTKAVIGNITAISLAKVFFEINGKQKNVAFANLCILSNKLFGDQLTKITPNGNYEINDSKTNDTNPCMDDNRDSKVDKKTAKANADDAALAFAEFKATTEKDDKIAAYNELVKAEYYLRELKTNPTSTAKEIRDARKRAIDLASIRAEYELHNAETTKEKNAIEQAKKNITYIKERKDIFKKAYAEEDELAKKATKFTETYDNTKDRIKWNELRYILQNKNNLGDKTCRVYISCKTASNISKNHRPYGACIYQPYRGEPIRGYIVEIDSKIVTYKIGVLEQKITYANLCVLSNKIFMTKYKNLSYTITDYNIQINRDCDAEAEAKAEAKANSVRKDNLTKLERAQFAKNIATNKVDEVKAEVDKAENDISKAKAEANLAKARANLAKADANLAATKVTIAETEVELTKDKDHTAKVKANDDLADAKADAIAKTIAEAEAYVAASVKKPVDRTGGYYDKYLKYKYKYLQLKNNM